jgi:hypothetical protein
MFGVEVAVHGALLNFPEALAHGFPHLQRHRLSQFRSLLAKLSRDRTKMPGPFRERQGCPVLLSSSDLFENCLHLGVGVTCVRCDFLAIHRIDADKRRRDFFLCHSYLKLTTVPSGFAIMAVFRVPRTVNLYSTLPPRVTFIPLT